MTWLIGAACFAIGLCAGALLFRHLASDQARIRTLEDRLAAMEQEHEGYKGRVNEHFNDSAQLLNDLTESYRQVYQHVAAGAQSLCPEDVSERLSLLAANSQEALVSDLPNGPNEGADALSPPFHAPRDYAAKTGPERKGNLAEDYGLGKAPDRSGQHGSG